jgi:UrcA family protein
MLTLVKSGASKLFCIAALHALTLGAASEAMAQSAAPAQLPQIVVHYGDTNLSTDAGARVLLKRLEAAARGVCGDDGGRISLADLSPFHRCYAKALNLGVSAVAAERLTALYRAKYGRTPIYTADRKRD